MNIIGDCAGELNTLITLVAKMPKDDVLCVGDIIDRGAKSRETIEWVMKNARCLMGNHEDLMIDHLEGTRRYESGIWFMNGGDTTLKSYGVKNSVDIWNRDVLKSYIPKEHLDWMMSLPTYYEDDKLFISHAPLNDVTTFAQAVDRDNLDSGMSIVWYRGNPKDIKGKLSIFGHNSHTGLKWYEKAGRKYAVCIDTSASRILTGLNTNTMEIFQQPYI